MRSISLIVLCCLAFSAFLAANTTLVDTDTTVHLTGSSEPFNGQGKLQLTTKASTDYDHLSVEETSTSLFEEFKQDIDIHPSVSDATLAMIPEIIQLIEDHLIGESKEDPPTDVSHPNIVVEIRWPTGLKPKTKIEIHNKIQSLFDASSLNSTVQFPQKRSDLGIRKNQIHIFFSAEPMGDLSGMDRELAAEMAAMMGFQQWPKGTVQCSVEGKLQDSMLSWNDSRAFEHKPWVVSPNSFLRGNRGAQKWIVEQSDGTHTSSEDAYEDAIHRAVHRVVRKPMSWTESHDKETEIVKKQVTESFTQTLKRPYGTFYRTFILLDNKNDYLIDRVRYLGDQQRAAQAKLVKINRLEHRRNLSVWMATPLLFGIIFIIAAVGNRLSRGFYSTRIHIAGVMAVILMAAAVIALTA